MDLIEQLVSKYPEKDDYVFSSCSTDWLLVLKKLRKPPNRLLNKFINNSDIIDAVQEFIPETITDEMHSGIKDKNYARFTTNTLLVIDIINKFSNQSTKNCIYDGPCKNGQIIYSTNKSPNIYYFKNPEVAYYYELNKVENGLYKEWYENGQPELECTYKDNKLNGFWKEWNESGQLINECTYIDGKEDGLHREWYESGQLEFESTYKNGKRDGLWKEWYENGKLHVECTYKNKIYDELYKQWYENGQLKEECTYKNGEYNGFHREWYESGQLYEEYTCKNGIYDGLRKKWNLDGVLLKECTYKNGTIIDK
jgi:antitoxin component YwqK of YwqJK toxin-antitoxin module